MFNSLICILTEHVWSPEDFNEFTQDMDIGDEVTTRCKRCSRRMATMEKLSDGSMRWTAHHPDAIIYELTEEARKLLATRNLKEGMQTNLDKFQEDFK